MREDPQPIPTLEQLNISDFTMGIVRDLQDLRANRISVSEARARAELAKQALRAIGYVLQAQKFLAGQAVEMGSLAGPAE